MPDNTIDWGQGSANNDIGWGKGPINNDLSWGMIGEDSYGHDETNLMGGGASFIDTFGQPAIGLSLRDLIGTNPTVLRVRRDSDNAEADFKASEVSNGTLENWVNQTQTLFDENFASSTGWTLRSGATISGGSLNLLNVTDTGEAAYKSYSAVPFQKVLITIIVTDYVQGAIYVTNLGGGGNTSPNITANGTYTYEITLGDGNTNWGIGTSAGPTTLKVSNLKVEQLTANGFVSTWYDQSGNGNDVTQTTSSAQPKIVSGGSTILENGKAAVQFDGGNDQLTSTFGTTYNQPTYSFLTHNFTSAPSVFDGVIGSIGTEHRLILGASLEYILQAGGALGYNQYSANQSLLSYKIQGSDPKLFFNGTQQSVSVGSAIGNTGLQGIVLGGIESGLSSGNTPVQIQELVIYGSDQDSNRTGIETNINDFYTIY